MEAPIIEAQLRKQVCDFLNIALPANSLYTFVPNELGHGKRPAGFVPGFPDLLFVHKGRAFFIELKRPDYRDKSGRKRKAVLRLEQKIIRDKLLAAGCPYAVCRSQAEVEGTLRAWHLVK